MKREYKQDSKFSYVMLALGLLSAMIMCVIFLLPSPLMTTILAETGWSVAQGGQLISIISLLTAVFVFVGSAISDKLGIKKTALISLTFACAGGVIPFFAGDSFALHYVGRILFGIGYGLGLNIAAMVIPVWFSAKLQPAMQGVRIFLSYFGLTLTLFIAVPVYNAIKSWQVTFGVFGVIAGVVLLLYLFIGRDMPAAQAAPRAGEPKAKEKSGILQAMKSRDIWLLVINMIGVMWVWNTFNTYLPTFYELEKGLSPETASQITGYMTLAGAIGGLICGAASAALGRRKPFGLPFLLAGCVGIVLSLLTSSPVLMGVGIGLFGFSTAGWTVLYSSVPAELPESNPAFYGGAMALIIGLSYLPGFIIPNVVSALYKDGAGLSLSTIFLAFTGVLLCTMVALLFVRETGPKGKLAMEKAASAKS